MYVSSTLFDTKKLIWKVKNAIDINRSKCGKYLPMSKIKIISKYNFFKLVNQKKIY